MNVTRPFGPRSLAIENDFSSTSPGASAYVYHGPADIKSVPAITVFIAENPAPVSGSKSARRTASCRSGSRLFRQIIPASRKEAPKPTIVWWLTDGSRRKVGGAEVAGLNRTARFSVRRSPAREETIRCPSWPNAGGGAAQTRATMRATCRDHFTLPSLGWPRGQFMRLFSRFISSSGLWRGPHPSAPRRVGRALRKGQAWYQWRGS